jgi:hypothetical protein
MREPTTHSLRASLALALETARLGVRARDTQVVIPTALLWFRQPSWQTWAPGCGQTEHWTGRALAYGLSPSMVLGNPLVGSAPSPQPWPGPGVRHIAEGPAAGLYARVVVTRHALAPHTAAPRDLDRIAAQKPAGETAR